MQENTIRRRALLGAGVGALAGVLESPAIASALSDSGLSPKNREIIRRYYAAWEQKDWHPFDLLLADDFTFTSANNDDHISKAAFKARCWESQVNFIQRFDLKHVIGHGNEVFVMYVCHTTNDKTFQNVEYIELRERQLTSLECYFGAQASFASSVSRG